MPNFSLKKYKTRKEWEDKICLTNISDLVEWINNHKRRYDAKKTGRGDAEFREQYEFCIKKIKEKTEAEASLERFKKLAGSKKIKTEEASEYENQVKKYEGKDATIIPSFKKTVSKLTREERKKFLKAGFEAYKYDFTEPVYNLIADDMRYMNKLEKLEEIVKIKENGFNEDDIDILKKLNKKEIEGINFILKPVLREKCDIEIVGIRNLKVMALFREYLFKKVPEKDKEECKGIGKIIAKNIRQNGEKLRKNFDNLKRVLINNAIA